ncbi:NUDIX hydrolase [Deinococcus sp. Arct2-2]|uniref:NUDIX hydrolase n=1 Tax=Deinococcus sp. Arct2-2 TaxID=2568653 RepID=UPI0010A4C6A5|nr:NUDIX hydrolase [Deinococcus sp. Arct2-2]THF72001.1 NUDIX hydrolase [Deinococcus sp. Arct2-2]
MTDRPVLADPAAPQPWEVTRSTVMYQDRFLKIRTDQCLTPAGVVVPTYHVIEALDWVNVLALTPEFEVVLAEEYRHAVGLVLSGLPSGNSEIGEAHAEAARRELLEETGYSYATLIPVSSSFVSTGTITNRVHSFLGLDAQYIGPQNLDPNEQVRVRVVPFLDWFRAARADALHTQSTQQVTHLQAMWGAVSVILSGQQPSLEPLRGPLLELLSSP